MPSQNRRKIAKDMKQLKRELQYQYESTLPTHLRGLGEKKLKLKDHFSKLEIKQENDFECNTKPSSIGMEDIVQYNQRKQFFDNVKHILKIDKNTNTNRILICGKPGFGKSTLIKQVALDWANREAYLSQFELVFLLGELKDVGNIYDLLRKQVPGTKLDNNTLQKLIEKHEEKILLLIDGFSEIKEEERKIIIPILEGKVFRQMTVIVTTVSIMTVQIQWNLVCYVPGVKSKDIGTQHIDQNNFDLTKETFDKLMKDHLRGMLLWSLMSYVPTELKTNSPPTKTTIFKYFLNHSVKRALVSNQLISPSSDVDIFNLQRENQPSFMGRLFRFGEFALEALKTERFNFTEEEILKTVRNDKKIFQIGILVPSLLPVIESDGSLKKTCAIAHVSFLEFFAAYNIWRLIRTSSKNNEVEIQMESFINEVSPIRYSFFYGFLAGLLGNEKGTSIIEFLLKKKAIPTKEKVTYEVKQAILYIITENEYSEKIDKLIQSYI